MRTKGSRNKERAILLSNRGYLWEYEPNHPMAMKNGYTLVHRKLAYDAGMLTDKSLEVHHINENKQDNRLENLLVLDKASHTKITWTGRERQSWSEERKSEKSKQMIGNQNWKGMKYNIYANPELLESAK